MSNNLPPVLYVVEVNTRQTLSSNSNGYKEKTCKRKVWEKRVLDNPNIICIKSPVADLCGFHNLSIYVSKSQCKPGMGSYYRKGGMDAVMTMLTQNQDYAELNNGAVTFLTTTPDTGFTDWWVTGKAYIVCDEGKYPLSKGQVWGIQEMINCVMDVYDAEHMREGEETLHRWAEEYRSRTFVPPSGTGGIDIYSGRMTT